VHHHAPLKDPSFDLRLSNASISSIPLPHCRDETTTYLQIRELLQQWGREEDEDLQMALRMSLQGSPRRSALTIVKCQELSKQLFYTCLAR
jgi:predicted amidophosphoribosyltransferase